MVKRWRFLNLTLLVLAGCGAPAYYPVVGQITFDGQPLVGAAVTFVPVGPGQPGVGCTDANGRYKLETGNALGVRPGEYDVCVMHVGATASSDDARTAAAVKAGVALPVRYAKPESSGLRVTVPGGAFDFALTPN